MNSAGIFALLTVTLALIAASAGAQTQAKESGPAEPKANAETYQTLYLSGVTQQQEANDIVTDLRNMLPKARLYYVPSQNAISVRATSDEIQLAQKILSDIDRPRKTYRLTYTVSETDGGKAAGTQHFTLVVAAGGKTQLKQGDKVPIVTGSYNEGSSNANSQVQYLDVGLNVDASLDAYSDGLRLHSKIEQSSVADEKSGIGTQDPIVRQTTLDVVSTLAQGKPLVLGSLDIPGGTRRQQIEVVSEPIP
ncbi:secretin N-terminal domain-containing protein [Alloacidobacterium sp.]|uniref:secretin N-terminal domain-containing protein n=1 Tax=Alloacidobacterium sp. TaxID=2951999 RepID=UPI002D537396|nr:secretin N-terminal domain-containing protein [Alloacidobacterium sp.]HYK35401.1 secretin N-terminal domain-containing protein [Alloacidobacterium sp.]